jgi:hypothetical protein
MTGPKRFPAVNYLGQHLCGLFKLEQNPVAWSLNLKFEVFYNCTLRKSDTEEQERM